MRFNPKRVILWLPAVILVAAVFVVLLLITTDNSQRISDLETGSNQQTITFTFQQGAARFRILCKEDTDNPTVYICSTIRVAGPSPTPSNSPGG